MKPETIKAISTNILFALGVILVVIGFIRGSSAVVNSLAFNEYPLDEWQESRCMEVGAFQSPLLLEKDQTAFLEAKEHFEQQKIECEKTLERVRRTKQVTDFTYSFGFFASGIVLAVLFK